MELQLIEKGFDYARKRKKWIFIMAAVGFTGYGAYRFYHAPSIARQRNRISKLLGAFLSVAEAVSESADAIGVVSRDMKEFLQSNSDQVPNSIKQISKITASDEFSHSLTSVTKALTEGVLRGRQSMNRSSHDQTNASSSLAERVVDKMFTPAGSGFASVVVGSFARNLILAYYANEHSGEDSNSSNARHLVSNSELVPGWVDAVCGDKCKELIGNCVQLFVSTAVAVYLDKTMHINTYDDLFSGLTNPKHEPKVRDMVVTVCNGAIETLVKTSHHVLTSSNPNVDSSSTSYLAIEECPSSIRKEDMVEEISRVEEFKEGKGLDEGKESGWVSKVSSTLAVPSNRRLVLDVTGRVTFETVRSFMEFLLETFLNALERCAVFVHEAVVEVVRYAAAKSFVLLTICLSLCLHIIGGAWALIPA